MLATDRDALLCDMAETYHIWDYEALPVETLAALASGLRDNSRIKMKLAGLKYIPVETVLPQIADRLTLIYYFLGSIKEDPQLLTDVMLGKVKSQPVASSFVSGEDFKKAWERMTRGDIDG